MRAQQQKSFSKTPVELLTETVYTAETCIFVFMHSTALQYSSTSITCLPQNEAEAAGQAEQPMIIF